MGEVTETVEGEGWAVGTIDAMGDGPGFRKIRRELGVQSVGVNAIVLPPEVETHTHYHDRQEEIYFVHRGRLRITFGEGEGEGFELGEGGVARVDAATWRRVANVGDAEAVYVVVGAQGGYVGRDGHVAEGEITWPGKERAG